MRSRDGNGGFHNSIILAKTGSKIYVVDEDGNKLSGGHHSVRWTGRDDGFEGKTGASNYGFSVNTSAIEPWNHRLNRTMNLEEVIEYASDTRIKSFAAYLMAYDEVPSDERVSLGDINFPSVE